MYILIRVEVATDHDFYHYIESHICATYTYEIFTDVHIKTLPVLCVNKRGNSPVMIFGPYIPIAIYVNRMNLKKNLKKLASHSREILLTHCFCDLWTMVFIILNF